MGHQAKVKRARRWIEHLGRVRDEAPKRDNATFLKVAAKFAKRLGPSKIPSVRHQWPTSWWGQRAEEMRAATSDPA